MVRTQRVAMNMETKVMLRMLRGTPIVLKNVRGMLAQGRTVGDVAWYLRARTEAALVPWFAACEDAFVAAAVRTAIRSTVDYQALVFSISLNPEAN
jgi:hypothetical protein